MRAAADWDHPAVALDASRNCAPYRVRIFSGDWFGLGDDMWAKRISLVLNWPKGHGRRGRAGETVAIETPAVSLALPRVETEAERAQRGRAWWRKHDRLRPADDSLEAFVSWWISHGGDAGDEFLMDHYADVSDAMGWSLPETPAIAPAKPMPRPVAAPASLLPALSGANAAGLFLAWLRETNRHGRYSSTDLQALYAEHAKEIGREETPENVWRPVFKDLSGVTSAMADIKSAKGNRAERRKRSMHYTIHQEAEDQLRIAA